MMTPTPILLPLLVPKQVVHHLLQQCQCSSLPREKFPNSNPPDDRTDPLNRAWPPCDGQELAHFNLDTTRHDHPGRQSDKGCIAQPKAVVLVGCGSRLLNWSSLPRLTPLTGRTEWPQSGSPYPTYSLWPQGPKTKVSSPAAQNNTHTHTNLPASCNISLSDAAKYLCHPINTTSLFGHSF